jgi:peptide/nickel transport system ATP-binding protein
MYLGQPVETSPSGELFKNHLHPYSKALLAAIPSIDIHVQRERVLLKGEITSPINPKPGCRFAARCPYMSEHCAEPQRLEEILPNHFVSCCRVREINNLREEKS